MVGLDSVSDDNIVITSSNSKPKGKRGAGSLENSVKLKQSTLNFSQSSTRARASQEPSSSFAAALKRRQK